MALHLSSPCMPSWHTQGQLYIYLCTAYFKILSVLQAVLLNVTKIGENYMIVMGGDCGRNESWPNLIYRRGTCLDELRRTTNTKIFDFITQIYVLSFTP